MRPTAWYLLPSLLAVTGCDILGLGSCVTTASGTVYEDGIPVPGVEVKLEMAVGEIVDLTASFAATDAPDPGGTHRDEVDWLWDGNPRWTWEGSGDAPMHDLRYDVYHTYAPPSNWLSFLAEDEGDFVVVWSLVGSPFTDTIRIRVVEPE